VVGADALGGLGSHDDARRVECNPERTVEALVSQREILEAEV
jgi:hypothetical protein